MNGRPRRLAKRSKLIRERSKRLRKKSVSRENVVPKSKRRKLHANSNSNEEPRKENKDNAISKRESDLLKKDKLLPLKLKKLKKAKLKMSNKMKTR